MRLLSRWTVRIPAVAAVILLTGSWLRGEVPSRVKVYSAASRGEVVAPGSLAVVRIDGEARFVPEATSIDAWQTADPPVDLGGIRVLFNGAPGRLIYVTPEEIFLVLPPDCAAGEAQVEVRDSDAQVVARGTARVEMLAPGLFSEDNSGKGKGRIYNAETWEQGPFRVRTSLADGAKSRTRILLSATGLRGAVAGQPRDQGAERVQVDFMAGTARWSVDADSISAAADYAGLDIVTVTLPSELNGNHLIHVGIRAGEAESNYVSFELLLEDPPVVESVVPAQAGPGEVIRITGKGLAGATDGRDRVIFEAENGASAVITPLRAEAVDDDAAQTALEVVVPPLPGGEAGAWFEGSVKLCVETDGLAGCAAEPFRILKAEAPQTPPGDVLLGVLEKIYEAAGKAAGSEEDAQTIAAIRERARADLRRKIDAALAGVPEEITLALEDGTEVRVLFDLTAIGRMETLLANGSSSLQKSLELLVARTGNQTRAAVDAELERQLMEAKLEYDDYKRLGETIAKGQLAIAASSLTACLVSGPVCVFLAEALTTISPILAGMALIPTATVMSIEFGPNTLTELRVSPSRIEIAPGQSTELDVRGRFSSLMDPSLALEEAASVVLSRFIADAFGLGFSAGYLVEKTIRPAVKLVVSKMMELGLANYAKPGTPTTRDVGLSWETVNSNCIRGSSPSSSAAFFLGSWEVRGIRGMESAERCQFAAKKDRLLMLPGAEQPATALIRVTGPTGCYPLPSNAPLPLFTKVFQVTAPNAAGKRLVLGQVAGSSEYMLLQSLPLPSPNEQMICGWITLAPGCRVEAYLPTPQERSGDYSAYPSLIDPLGPPFPGNIIPRARMGPGGLFGMPVKSVDGCGQ